MRALIIFIGESHKKQNVKNPGKKFYIVIKTYQIVDSRNKTEQVFMKDKSCL